jgi:hypothetical protein
MKFSASNPRRLFNSIPVAHDVRSAPYPPSLHQFPSPPLIFQHFSISAFQRFSESRRQAAEAAITK